MTYSLPDIPKDTDFEDYVSAYYQLSGKFLERGVIYRVGRESCTKELLEMDIVTSDVKHGETERNIVEIKSKGWGCSEIFKVAGWMRFLDIPKGTFIVQETDKSFDVSRDMAAKLDIALLSDLNLDAKEITAHLGCRVSEPWFGKAVTALRYAYAVEHEMIDANTKEKNNIYKTIKAAKSKGDPEPIHKECYRRLSDYISDMTNNTFFERDAVNRVNKLFGLFCDNHNFTARMANEVEGSGFPDDSQGVLIPRDEYHKLHNDPDRNVLQLALYAELINRLLVLKCAVEYALSSDKVYDNSIEEFLAKLSEASLGSNIRTAAAIFAGQPYSHLYPYFWQIFIYLFGGFILKDKKTEEYALLSQITGIPETHLDEAFNSFDCLFPLPKGGWLISPSQYSNIIEMKLFPLPMRGAGANFRRWIYTSDGTYDTLSKSLTGRYTAHNLSIYNNAACSYLSCFATSLKQG